MKNLSVDVMRIGLDHLCIMRPATFCSANAKYAKKNIYLCIYIFMFYNAFEPLTLIHLSINEIKNTSHIKRLRHLPHTTCQNRGEPGRQIIGLGTGMSLVCTPTPLKTYGVYAYYIFAKFSGSDCPCCGEPQGKYVWWWPTRL